MTGCTKGMYVKVKKFGATYRFLEVEHSYLKKTKQKTCNSWSSWEQWFIQTQSRHL